MEIGDNSAILLHELISDNDAMEDYIWSRIMSMHWEISLVSASHHSNYWKEWTV